MCKNGTRSVYVPLHPDCPVHMLPHWHYLVWFFSEPFGTKLTFQRAFPKNKGVLQNHSTAIRNLTLIKQCLLHRPHSVFSSCPSKVFYNSSPSLPSGFKDLTWHLAVSLGLDFSSWAQWSPNPWPCPQEGSTRWRQCWP